MVEIQYLQTTITDEQRREFGQLVEDTIRHIESAQFLPHSGIRFPQNPCSSCAHLGLCLGKQDLVDTSLIRRPGAVTLIGLTSLTTNGTSPMPPKLNRERAVFVLSKIDEILAWEKRTDAERDTKFVELGRYLCEVRAGQYWRLEKLKSFDEFLARRFPESRRKAYYLMAIHEHLPRRHGGAEGDGMDEGTGLGEGGAEGSAEVRLCNLVAQSQELPKEEFKREVERHLTGEETEPWEIIYFKLYKSQIPVIERALETAALMLGTTNREATAWR